MKYESITEESVAALLGCFYTKIRRDPVLAPIYSETLGERWDIHVATMHKFWCSALRLKPGYRGDMLAVHQTIGRLKPSLFPRWLARFREAVAECFAEAPASVIDDRARKTARNLETALFKGRGDAAERTHGSPIMDQRNGLPWSIDQVPS
ncbi:MAG: group III truncated hemoglobin [Stellaceae bacterium]